MNNIFKKLCILIVALSLVVLFCKIQMLNAISSKNIEAEKKVLVASKTFSKELYYEGEINKIRNIFLGGIDAEEGPDLAVFGLKEMHILNPYSGATKAEIKLQWAAGIYRPELICDKPGSYTIISRECLSDAGFLMDKNGKLIWKYAPGLVHSMAAADLNNDGELEYYVATSNGLHQLNSKGKMIWKNEGVFYDVEIYNNNVENIKLAAAINLSKRMQFRDYYGKVIREIQFKDRIYNFGHFEFISWTGQNQILSYAGKNFFLFDSNGKLLLKHSLKQAMNDIRGAAVKFEQNKGPFLAIIAKFSSSIQQSMLCIFDPNGDLVYKELIGVSMCLLPISLPSSENEALLVGEWPNKIYKYSSK